jgi:pumilio family protein 6
MPTAITTENTMSGTKRKSAPVKDVHIKESKKPKIDSGLNSAMKSKKSKPVKVVEESSDSGSEDSDSEGGAPLFSESVVSSEEEDDKDEESGSEEVPKEVDGLHPDRAKAVVNSRSRTHPARTLVNN